MKRSHVFVTLVLTIGLAAATLTNTSVSIAAQPQRAIRRSDVVFMYDNPKMYEPYGCTVLGWAGRANAEHIEAAHKKGVRHFSSSVGFLTEFRRVIDFDENFLDAACRNFVGEPFIVPWLWDHHHKYKNQPAWWWCTNSPLYRRYLDSRLVEVMKAKPDGLHIDDYRGTSGAVTWREACFCRHCMTAFRDYLAKNVSKEELAKLGITDVAKFDYRAFLLDAGIKPEEYKRRRTSLPLADRFYHFQVMADNRFVAGYRKRAEELRGKPLTLCVNSGLSNPHALVIAPHLSYFCCEVHHQAAARRCPTHPVYIYKLADGLDRPVTSTASGQDWAFVMEHKLPGLVRTWTALSYAFGHTLMAPHRQWCYNKEKGTHWYDGPTDQYAYLYRFVRDRAALLDDYEAAAPVAVVYDNAARRKGKANIEPICIALAQRNMPFTVVVAGDDWLDYRLTAQRLAQFKAVILPGSTSLDAAQQRLIDEVAKTKKLVTWPDVKRLDELVPMPVSIDGVKNVWAVPRVKTSQPDAPAVVHLLNRNYDAANDAMVAQKDFTVRLRRDLFDGRAFTAAVLHQPKSPPVKLNVTSDDAHTTIKIPTLELWGIVELHGK